MVEEELYKRDLLEGAPLKACVTNEKGKTIAKSIHEGTSGAH